MLVVVVGLFLTAAAAFAAPTAAPTKTPGVLTVGFDVPAPGFWNGRVTGTTIKNPTGFEAQLAQAIAKNLGIGKVVFVRAPFGGLFSPSSKPYDFAMEEATITPAAREGGVVLGAVLRREPGRADPEGPGEADEHRGAEVAPAVRTGDHDGPRVHPAHPSTGKAGARLLARRRPPRSMRSRPASATR